MTREEINTALRKIAILAMGADRDRYDMELIIRQLVKLGVVGIEDGYYVFEFDEVEGYEVREAKRAMLQPQERPKGRWEYLSGDEWLCSNCGYVISTEGSWEKPTAKFCEDCGADCRESEDI